jgi:non-heme chloroperoxidase
VNVNGIRLHYLDWGGDGPVLLLLTGMGNSAYIFGDFAPRFVDQYHVIALTRRGHGDSDCPETGYDVDTLTQDIRLFMDSLGIDRAILAGHSMSNIEICHFAALYPERVLKVVFLDAAYDRTSTVFKSIREQNPMRFIQVDGANDDYPTIEEHIAALLKYYPFYAKIWGNAMSEDLLHITARNAEGMIIYKMPDSVGAALVQTMNNYIPENAIIRAPVLSIFALNGGDYFLSPDFMTEEQKQLVYEFFDRIRPALQRELIAQFQSDLPTARIVGIPNGHHYCFIQQADTVVEEMRKFLQE